MKQFWKSHVAEPFIKMTWYDRVFMLSIPVCGLLTWLIFALRLFTVNDLPIYGYNLFSTIEIDGSSYTFNGIKEIFVCLLMTGCGIYALIGHTKMDCFIQAGISWVGLVLFTLFALLNVKSLNSNGCITIFTEGTVFPIIMTFLMFVSATVLTVHTMKKSRHV